MFSAVLFFPTQTRGKEGTCREGNSKIVDFNSNCKPF